MDFKKLTRQMDEPTRRSFMMRMASTFLGVSILPQMMPAQVQAARSGKSSKNNSSPVNVIYLYMNGGMSHIDTLDPKPGTDVQGPTQVINTNVKGIKVGEHMSNFAKHADKTAILRGMSSTQGAHEQAYYLMHTSYAAIGTINHPSIGTWIMNMQGRTNTKLPGNIVIGSGYKSSGFMQPNLGPLIIGDPNKGLQNSKLPRNVNDEQFNRRLKLASRLDRTFSNRYRQPQVKAYNDMYNDAITLMQSQDLATFDLNKESKNVRNLYGNNSFGQGCLLARRLVQNNVRFVEVSLTGWDMHDDMFTRGTNLIPKLDQALGALLTDLTTLGILDRTLVVLATEFGRTPKINANQGRDHYPKAFSCMLAGANIQGGQVIGKTDANAANVETDKVTIADFNATIATAVGLDVQDVIMSPSQRPFTVANKGKPIPGIFTT
ncbi:MAG: DUF1501 domain-containing protein [Phycisphaeraceae bacterium]|nr:DUF1501 domain-containing protein [Phycisphaeraceae bacterium]